MLDLEPGLLAAGLATATLASEDAALLLASGLAASGQLGWMAAALAVGLGIVVGDLGLYAAGYWAGHRMSKIPILKKWIGPGALVNTRQWGERNLTWAVLVTRFVPGSRLPAYLAAGSIGLPFWRFSAAVGISVALWVALIFWLAAGGAWLGTVGALSAVLMLMGVFRLFAGRGDQVLRAQTWIRRWGHPEFWPAAIFYLPIIPHYIRLGLRYRSLLLPSSANPAVPGGGLINESKQQILALIPPGPHSLQHRLCLPGEPYRVHADWMKRQGLSFPIIAKPDRGQRGSGVRLLRDMDGLRDYHRAITTPYLLQEYCAYGNEAGVFYVRRPEDTKGSIYSLTDKRFPELVGDGQRDIRRLVLEHPRYSLQAGIFLARHQDVLGKVLKNRERFRLAEAGNHCQGTLFLDGHSLAGTGLLRALDRLVDRMAGFYVGRFDIRYLSPGAFAKGRGFKIIELNAGGAEATHIYDPSIPYVRKMQVLKGQWDLLFERGAYERERGTAPIAWEQFVSDLLQYRRDAALHPGTD